MNRVGKIRVVVVAGFMLMAMLAASGLASAQSEGREFTFDGYTYSWSLSSMSDIEVRSTPDLPDALPVGVDPVEVERLVTPPTSSDRLPDQNSRINGEGCTGVPDSYFAADFTGPCAAHDGCYSILSTRDRIDCDRALLADLSTECIQTYSEPNPLFYGCVTQSNNYYQGVRALGGSAYDGIGNPA